MELIERMGGLGRIQVHGEEQTLLEKLLEYTSEGHYDALRTGDSYPQYAPEKKAFRDVIQQLFPSFPLITGSYGQFTVIDRKNESYNRLGVCQERLIGSSLFLSHARPQKVDLCLITSSKEPGYFMTIAFDSSYSTRAEDDLVSLLGRWEFPEIRGAAPIPQEKPEKWTTYGLADIPALGKVLQKYEQASHLVQNIQTLASITSEQLEVLRRDSVQHENVAIRELSNTRYQKVLDALVYHQRLIST